MGIKKRIILLLFTALMSIAVLSSCDRKDSAQTNSFPVFTSYRDIPNITDAEIAAIQALREQYEYFIYGMTPALSFALNCYLKRWNRPKRRGITRE